MNASTASNSNSNNENSSKVGRLKWINLFAFVLNVAVTYGIGVSGIFGLPTNAELSEKYQTVVTPAGWAFAIWGVIFLAQGLWVATQFFRLSDQFQEPIAAVQCNYLFVVLAQVAWTLTFSNELIVVSAAMMALILWNLSVIVISLAKIDAKNAQSFFLLHFPFQIHFGWILAATVVNVNVVLVAQGYSSTVQFYSAVAGLAVLVGTALMLLLFMGSSQFVPPMVVAWALWGVYAELSRSPKESIVQAFSTAQLKVIQYSALVAAILLVAISVAVAIRHLVRRRRSASSSTTTATQESGYVRVNDERRQ